MTAVGPCCRRPTMGAPSKRDRAFTLIEVMVVVVIITILVGALVPEFSGTFVTIQMRARSGEVGDMMAYCYSSACAQQTDYRLNFDPEWNRVWVTREVESETGERSYQPVQPIGTHSLTLPEIVRFDVEEMELGLNAGEEGCYYIQFRRDGTADFCRMKLIAHRGDAIEIALNGLTGRVTIRELPPEELKQQGQTESEG